MSLPLVLCSVGEESGLPNCLLKLLKQHFTVIPSSELDTISAHVADQIVAVVKFFGKPKITEELLDKLPNVKLVACCSSSYDHFDFKLLQSRGVRLSNAPSVSDDSVADFGMLLLMAAGRNFYNYASIATSPETTAFNPNDVVESDVHGSTVGIVGMGRIGYRIALRAIGFNMKILYHNRSRRSKSDEELVNATYYKNLNDMLPLSDYLLVTVCLTPETTNMLKDEHFELMKPSAIFVNISRGSVVDQDALVRALSNKKIKFAALDVTSPEPLPRDHPLLKLPNVIITPHCCTATATTRLKMMQKAVDNIRAALEGRPMPSEVTQ